MSREPDLALAITLVIVATVLVFLAGSWYGSRDRICVTAPSQGATVVYCAHGTPARSLEQ